MGSAATGEGKIVRTYVDGDQGGHFAQIEHISDCVVRHPVKVLAEAYRK